MFRTSPIILCLFNTSLWMDDGALRQNLCMVRDWSDHPMASPVMVYLLLLEGQCKWYVFIIRHYDGGGDSMRDMMFSICEETAIWKNEVLFIHELFHDECSVFIVITCYPKEEWLHCSNI
ncbi:hypothetical protein CHS0354_028129 [Potamilus streckersoni]|uniref:Uncharacterized protein n=1 Tax=Potamilus streckersoni TaxID=2493646 RepID=A0AAE0TJF4_9BIVA|nr:hypothetical protein CHS0354_028129 [Potamilus streckersoni]